jgi:hypothetical protein
MYLPTFDAAEWVRVATSERITHAMVVPTMLGRILDEVESTGAAPPALRHLSYGGAACRWSWSSGRFVPCLRWIWSTPTG